MKIKSSRTLTIRIIVFLILIPFTFYGFKLSLGQWAHGAGARMAVALLLLPSVIFWQLSRSGLTVRQRIWKALIFSLIYFVAAFILFMLL